MGIGNPITLYRNCIEELNEKYNFNDVGVIIQKSDRISNYYKDIINKNNLKVDKSSTKNKEIKSKSMSEKSLKKWEIVQRMEVYLFRLIYSIWHFHFKKIK